MSEPSSTTQSHHDNEHEHGHDHGGGLGTYVAVFIALCVLTSASFFTYSSYWPFNEYVAWAFMMAVSCCKAMLVILFFMHLKYEANWKYVLTIPAAFMSIFMVLMLVPDVGWRMDPGLGRKMDRERLRHMAPVEVHEAGDQSHDGDEASENAGE